MSLIHSIRARLALWHTLTLAAVLLAFAAGTWVFLARTSSNRVDRAMAQVSAAFERGWRDDIVEDTTTAVAAADSGIIEFRDRETRLAVYDFAGALIALSDSTPLAPELAATLSRSDRGPLTGFLRSASNGTVYTTLDRQAFPIRAQARQVSIAGHPYLILTLRSLAAERETAESFARVLAIAIPLALLVAAIGGYLLARTSLAPVVAMARQAEHIGATTLGERLPVANARDELGGLAHVLNGLLDRLERAFQQQERAAEQQRQFMADASHELRTPVTALQTTADVALARPDRDSKELRDALDVVRGEARRLARIVEDLFLLARADSGQLAPRRETLYLDDLVEESARAVRALAGTRGVTLSVAGADEAPYVGDSDLLRRAVMILLDNGIKYTPRGGSVRLSVRVNDGADRRSYAILVDDSGPGIPEGARDRIFERFVRLDSARGRDTDAPGGTGLGLAIARWIAEAHGGTVKLESSGPDGSRFVLELPSEMIADRARQTVLT